MQRTSELEQNLRHVLENRDLPAPLRARVSGILEVGFAHPPLAIGGQSANQVLNVECLTRSQYVEMASGFRREIAASVTQHGINGQALDRATMQQLREISERINGSDGHSAGRIYDSTRALFASNAPQAGATTSVACPATPLATQRTPAQAR